MSALNFIRPEFLWAALLVPVLFVLARNALARQSAWFDVVAKPLQPFVLSKATEEPRRGLLAFLVSLCWLLAVVAAAGPAWDKQPVPLSRSGDSLVVALDLSRSMDVTDLSPSRLVRARVKLLDILERRPGGYTGLIVYSANAFTVVPLTDDADTIRVLLASLTTDIMPSRGSYPAAAIRKAMDLLAQSGALNGQVLLLGDGGVDAQAIEAAEALKAAGHRLSVLGVGTRQGGPVPARDGGFERDRSGKVAVVGLPTGDLRKLALAGGGRFAVIRTDDADLDTVLQASAQQTDAKTDNGDSLDTELWIDNGYWLVLALLPLTALLFRRGWMLCFVVTLSFLATPRVSYAFSFTDWFKTQDQRAADAFAAEDYALAQEQFEDSDWAASAAYRAGDFVTAAELLAERESPTARFNRGNALAMQGDIDAAIESYQQALDKDPDHEDARYNKELLEQLKEQSESEGESSTADSSANNQDQQQGESQSSDDQSSEGSEGDASNESGENAEQQDSENGSDTQDSDSGADASQDDSSEATDEQVSELQKAMAEALEQAGEPEPGDEPATARAMSAEEREDQERSESEAQWLRRIEHDPGALLRRKFLRQYRNSGVDQDGGSLWPDNEEEPW